MIPGLIPKAKKIPKPITKAAAMKKKNMRDDQNPDEENVSDLFDEVESPMILPPALNLPGPEFVAFM
ncbi:hypothetical protein VC83_01548 [Pseudogymnoascus destructans]|uniref:Uncharacterized protein n=1 Tax=Pseudogymnoascus destructans TaxID=655981 RepID=A0A177AKE3_9PEZI|nr:uncharacterized protein VC83_01548 [Pseudogymnoascus destructans]OAF61962.1 hypothetical protein VC83_01548 [Pseudogymnoascus destructans]